MKKEIIMAEAVILLSRLARIRRDGPDFWGLLSAGLLTAAIILGILWRENADE